jgi:hypothetical protein
MCTTGANAGHLSHMHEESLSHSRGAIWGRREVGHLLSSVSNLVCIFSWRCTLTIHVIVGVGILVKQP